jgi:hypothetical protein
MDTNAPIFSKEFITSYGDWIKAIGSNSLKVYSYITLNCLFIHFFERLANPDIAFGDILENAPYYYISANNFSDDKIPGVTTRSRRKTIRANAPDAYDLMTQFDGDKMINRIIPRFFRIDKTTALPPYTYVIMPGECPGADSGGTECNDEISKDTFISYYFTAITYIMWGYRVAFKFLSNWNAILIYQSSTPDAIWYQICMKFLLFFGCFIFLIIGVMSFFSSMFWGIYSLFFEHYPNMDVYAITSINCEYLLAFFPVGWVVWPFCKIFNPIRLWTWYFALMFFQFIVAMAAMFSGILLWMLYIPFSMFFWIFYPILEMWKYNYVVGFKAKIFGVTPLSENIIKNYRSILDAIVRIYRENIQFIMFILVIIIYYSASVTMSENFTNGVGIVAGSIGLLILVRGIMQLFKSGSK